MATAPETRQAPRQSSKQASFSTNLSHLALCLETSCVNIFFFFILLHTIPPHSLKSPKRICARIDSPTSSFPDSYPLPPYAQDTYFDLKSPPNIERMPAFKRLVIPAAVVIAERSSSHHRLSSETIASIVVGSMVVFIVLIVGIWHCR